jgi:dienelactone hydrolase
MSKSIAKFCFPIVVISLLIVGGQAPITAEQSTSPTPAATAASPDVNLPALTGPYKVGRTEYEWVDQNRDETFASIPGLKRDLMVYIWFPASITKRTKIAPYMDGGLMWDASTLALPDTQGGFGLVPHPGLESLIHSHSYRTSVLDTTKPSYPVLVFVHGMQANAPMYTSILEEIASHGYVVIATSHPYSTDVISFPDGRLVTGGTVGTALTAGPSLLALWTQDVRFILDQAEKLNTTDHDFAGHLDLTRVGVFGHSFGGNVAIAVTAADSRVKVGLTLDATGLPDSVLPDLGTKPFLFLGNTHAEQQTQDKYLLQIDGMAHGNYSDLGLLLPLIPEMKLLGTIDPARGIQIVNSYVVAFFDHYLQGTAPKWPTFDEAHLTIRGSATSS